MNKTLRDFTNEELILYLYMDESIDLSYMSSIMSEILRRMNEKSPLLPKEEPVDWGNPLTP